MAGDGALERLGDYLREHRGGIVTDLVFALVWVTLVNALFGVVDGPTWAYYLLMAAGVVAYYGFFLSLETARTARDGRDGRDG